MDCPEKFKNISSGIQNIVLALAIIIGGIWTLWTFISLDSVNKAKAELIALESSINKVSLDIDLSIKELEPINKNKIGILVTVIVKNNGIKPSLLDLSESPLLVTKLIRDNDGYINSGKVYRLYSVSRFDEKGYTANIGANIQSGATKYLQFYEELDEEGVYHVSFNSPVSNVDERMLNESSEGNSPREVLENFEVDVPKKIVWVASKYYYVKKSNN